MRNLYIQTPVLSLSLFLCLFFSINISAQNNPSDVVHLQTIEQNLQVPIKLAIDSANNIFVTDSKQKSIEKYDASGNFIETTFIKGTPSSITVNSKNEVFVGTEEGKIIKLETSGSNSTFYTDTILPLDMEFDLTGNLYVVDAKSNRIIVLDIDANIIQDFGTGTLVSPTSIAIDKKNERILIGEHGGIGGSFTAFCTVWVFDLLGNQIDNFGTGGNGDGRFYRIQGIDIGKCGNIYVNEPFQGNVSVFDENFNFITKFGVYGDSLTQLNLPMDILFDNQERIIISSTNNSKIEIFNVIDSLPSSFIQNSDAIICSGETSDITITFTGTAPYTFTYAIDGINQNPITTSDNPYTLSVSTQGIYEITALSDATKTGTCFTGSAVIKVTNTSPTSVITTISDTICQGETVNVNIAFTGEAPWTFTYTQDGVNPTSISTTNNNYILPITETGIYEINNLIGNACASASNTGYAEITVNPLPSSSFAEGNNSYNLCQGDTFNLHLSFTGTAPWNFTYLIDEENPVTISDITNTNYVLPVTLAGTYEISQITDSFCTNTVTNTFPEIVLKPKPTVNTTNGNVSICSNSYLDITNYFTGTSPWSLTYTIDGLNPTNVNNITTNPFVMQSTTGLFQITQLSDANCSSSDINGYANISIVAAPVPDFTYVKNGLEVSFTNSSQNADSYLWDFGDTQTSTLQNPVHTYLVNDIYQVYLTATSDFCGDSSYVQTIDLILNNSIVNSDLLCEIFPNPSNGKFSLVITNNLQTDFLLEITSVNGQKIFNKKYNTNNLIENIDLSSQESGIYILKYITNKETITKKLIISK